MMTVKVNFKDDSVTTRINGTFQEIAEHYFSQPEVDAEHYFSQPGVESVDILDGAQEYETDYFRRTLTGLYRVDQKEIDEFDLYYNIRLSYKIEYKPEYKDQYEDREESCGFLRIA